ncbi:MAG: hypothetical protein ACR2NX_03235 [Chthoniobacterales bacterium]
MSVSYGSGHVFATTNDPVLDPGGSESWIIAQVNWYEDITINSPGHVGEQVTARFTGHASGYLTGNSAAPLYRAVYNINADGVPFSGDLTQQNGFVGTPLSAIATFTVDHGFFVGSPFPIHWALGAQVQADGTNTNASPPTGASATADVSLSMGGFTVLNAQNQPLDYTGESRTGSSRGSNIAPGAAFTGFSLTNSAPGRVGTNLSLLGGSASAATNVTAAFVAPPPAAVIQLASDAVDLNGTGSDLVVIQINYSAALAQTLFGSETGLRLAWFNAAVGQWFTAVAGNTGGTPRFLARAYNPATDLQLGNYGLDTVNKVVWAVINHNSEFGVTVVPDAPAMTGAVSRKTHGSAGTFDINLPLTGAPGVECRSSGGNHAIVFIFNNDVVSGNASLTTGAGTIAGSPSISGNTMTVNLSGVTDVQRITLTLSSVTDTFGQVLPDTAVSVKMLVGDTTGNSVVTASDVGQVKGQSGTPVTAANFREDVTANGVITASDIGLVKSRSGAGLP